MISEQVRKMTQVHWIMLFLAISIAWIFLYLLSVTKDIELSLELEIVEILSTTQLGSPFRVAFSISCNSPRLKLIDLDTTQM